MKKYIPIIIAIIITVIGMFFVHEILEKKSNDAKLERKERFKKEYEILNNKTDKNNKNTYPKVIIDTDIDILYKNEEEIVDIIKGGTGVIYFGYPECPWCRNIVPVLLEAASETSLQEIYYLNIKNIRDNRVLDANGNIVTKKEGTKGYYKIVDALSEYLSPYEGLNDESIKRLYAPTVIFIKDGIVTYIHVDTVESQKDPYIPLNETQKKELKDTYLKGMHKVLKDLCDESC